MTVADIERIGSPQVDRNAARRAFLEYRRATALESDPARRAEYDGLMRGYKAIAAGKQVIDLLKTMLTTGLQHDTLYPRLAIARADSRKCYVSMNTDGGAAFGSDGHAPSQWGRRRMAKDRVVRLPPGTFAAYPGTWNEDRHRHERVRRDGTAIPWNGSASAIVPIVPPHLNPRGKLANYHILWDAVWTNEPPVDPLLLRHLAGSLYAIVAHWDLSPLEQAVLRGRV